MINQINQDAAGKARAEQPRAEAPPTMEEIQALCKNLRSAHDAALVVADEFEAQKLALEKKFAPRLQAAAERINAAGGTLVLALTAAQPLFAEPKTQTFYGIRVGWMKGKGVIAYEADEATVIERAERLLAGKALGAVVKTTKKLVKKGLSALPADMLRRLGVTIGDTGDVPFVKPVEGDAIKKINALLKGAGEEEE